MTENKYVRGSVVAKTDADFRVALDAARVYRGDVMLSLSDGSIIEGYVFDVSNEQVSLYAANKEEKTLVPIANVVKLLFSGEDWAAARANKLEWLDSREMQ